MSRPAQRSHLALILGLALTGAAPAGAATVPGLATITGPADRATIVGEGPVTVTLRHAGGVRPVALSVNGREVALTPRRVRPGVVRITLRRAHGLRLGPNAVSVRSRRGGTTDADVVRFTRVRPARGLVGIAGMGNGRRFASAPVRVSLAVPARATHVGVWLNGRAVPPSQWERPWRAGRVVLQLSASDGLRHDGNVLRVVARRGTRGQTLVRRFVMAGDAPLPGAGLHRIAHAGTHVALDGRASRSRTGGTARTAQALDYTWRLLDAPEGSAGRLLNEDAAQPTLMTDVPGTYTAELVVTDGAGRSAPSTVTVDVVAPGLTPVRISGSGDDLLSITVGDTVYAADPSVETPAVHYVVLSRRTGQPVPGRERTVSLRDSLGLTRIPLDVQSLGNDVLVLMAQRDFRSTAPLAKGSVVLPATGLSSSLGWGSRSGPLTGYLASGGPGGLTFVRGDHRRFTAVSADAQSRANTVTVDGVAHTATLPADAVGGFQVLRLDPVTLGPVANTAVPTRGGPASAPYSAAALADALTAGGVAGDLVFVVSLGAPGSTVLPAGTIQALGGTPGALSGMDASGRYALAYAPDGTAVEVGTVIQADPSQATSAGNGPPRIDGFLTRRPDDALTIAPVGPASSVDALPEVVYRAPVPWPHSTTPGERAALAWFARELGLPAGVRAAYTQRNIVLAPLVSTLQTRQYPGADAGFTQADFSNVRDTLAAEFAAVSNVRATMDGLGATFGRQGLQNYVDVAATSAAIQQVVRPRPARHSFDLWRVLSGTLLAASKIAPGASGQALAFFGEVAMVGSELSRPATAPDPSQVVANDATALQAAVPERIEAIIDRLGGIEDAIVTDSGRLAAAQQRILSGDWAWTNQIAADTAASFRLGIQRESWVSMLRTVYAAYRLDTSKAERRNALGGMICWYSDPNRGIFSQTRPVYYGTSAPAMLTWRESGPLARTAAERAFGVPVGQVLARSTSATSLGYYAASGANTEDPTILPASLSAPLFTRITAARQQGMAPVGIYPPHLAAQLTQKTMSCRMGKDGTRSQTSAAVVITTP